MSPPSILPTLFAPSLPHQHPATHPPPPWAPPSPKASMNPAPTPNPSNNAPTGVNYSPNPATSLPIPPERQEIVRKITSLYSGSASEEDMLVYAKEAVYDDPWSFCDSRFKIAGQWYGIPKIMASSRTLATEIVLSDTDTLSFKMKQEYKPRLSPAAKEVNSLVTLTLDAEGRVVYHKDQWNEKEYSHEGVGMWLKRLNGDHLTKITRPPGGL